MRIVTDTKVGVSWNAARIGDLGLMLSVAVKGGFALKADGAMELIAEPPEGSGDQYSEGEDGKKELVYPSDFVPFKPRADLIFRSTAYAPGGTPVPHLDVSLRVGPLRKVAHVLGDRYWKRRFLLWSDVTPPAPFKSMPVNYARSFGGAKFKKNPIGLGFRQERLPNIESKQHPIRGRGSRPTPACFGPIDKDWEPRRSKIGTYGGNWQKKRWPWFPDDFDYGYFNAAPEDQQMEGYLRGDEELEFQNLHPAQAVYRTRLPGLRARAFVQVELPGAPAEFREVKLNLDTLWIDVEAEKAVLVWRGLTPVRSVKFKEVTHVAALTEPVASPLRTPEQMREWMRLRIAVEHGEGPPTPEEAAAAAAGVEQWQAFQKAMAALGQEQSELAQEFNSLESGMTQQFEREKAMAIAAGVDPKAFDPPGKPQTLADIKTGLAKQMNDLRESAPEAAAKLGGIEQDLDEMAKMESEFSALEAGWPAPPSGEEVRAAASQGKPLTNADLSGLDLSNQDLSRGDFSRTDFSGANLSGARFVNAHLKAASFREANLVGADFSGAILDDADLSGAKLEGARFSGASLAGASFGKLQLRGADFSTCKGRSPDFSGSNLEGARFSGARVPWARFTGANVKGADFHEAELVSADFGGASAEGINMTRADLTNLRAAEKADFKGGKFREAKAPKSIWEEANLEEADFSLAVLSGASFESASLRRSRFDRADLTKASFEDASAQQAILTNANLLRACFNRANLADARLDGSNLYEASFWETVFSNTAIEGANRKRTLIA